MPYATFCSVTMWCTFMMESGLLPKKQSDIILLVNCEILPLHSVLPSRKWAFFMDRFRRGSKGKRYIRGLQFNANFSGRLIASSKTFLYLFGGCVDKLFSHIPQSNSYVPFCCFQCWRALLASINSPWGVSAIGSSIFLITQKSGQVTCL